MSAFFCYLCRYKNIADMKNFFVCLITFMMMIPTTLHADSYTTLWKQVTAAQQKDQPKSQLEILHVISEKATKEKRYGHLLKAQLMTANVQTTISPDSLHVQVGKIAAAQAKAAESDAALKAVYDCVLGKIYAGNPQIDDEAEAKSKAFFKEALAQPDLLARTKAADYTPALITGIDSRIFYDDLLHVIGFEAQNYRLLHDYYLSHNNRPAACICAFEITQQNRFEDVLEVRKSKYLQTIDSLIDTYKDLPEAGELAIEHYRFMEQAQDASAEERMNYINYALLHWGAWPRMNILRNAQNQLTLPSFFANIEEGISTPQTDRHVRLNNICNIQQITMTVTPVSIDGRNKLDPNDSKDYQKLKRLMASSPVQEETRRYYGLPNYKVFDDSLTIKGLPRGAYLVEFTTDNKGIRPARTLLYVSDLYLIHEKLPGKQSRLVSVSATTGQPIPHVSIRLTNQNWDDETTESVTLTTNEQGEVVFTQGKNMPNLVYISTENDKTCPESNFSEWFNYYHSDYTHNSHRIYTDRKLYRPGQTVHAAVIAYSQNQDLKANVLAGQKIRLTLKDANYKEVESKELTTDEYGTAWTDFTLPTTGLTGSFTLSTQEGFARIQVEEYKRPTFQVEFDKVTTNYQAGDTVKVTGVARTFAGTPVQGAKVGYKVTRRSALWWYRGGGSEPIDIKTDTVMTDNEGHFTVLVPMIMQEDKTEKGYRYYSFVVKADVTDIAGETRQGSISLPLSTHPTLFSCDLPAQSERDSLQTMRFSYKNNAGEDISGSVTYRLNGHEYHAAANQEIDIKAIIRALPSGQYTLNAVCGADTIEQKIVIFTMEDTRPAYDTHDWFYQSADEFPADGSPVYIQMGASDEQQHIVYTLVCGDRILENGVIDQSNAITTRKFSYKPAYGDGLVLTCAWVRNGQLYQHSARISRPMPKREMTLSWTTFRDRLTPGQQETWSLHIDGPDGKPSKAQVLATLYDKSLDDILQHGWNLALDNRVSLPYIQWNGLSFDAIQAYGELPYKALHEPSLNFTHLDDNLTYLGGREKIFYALEASPRMAARKEIRIRGTSTVLMAKAATKASDNMAAENALEGRIAGLNVEAEDKVATDEGEEMPGTTTASVQMRENMNETAFFFPTLQTDKQGNLSFSFTLPESITTWKFMGLAHDQQMNHGLLTAQTVAKKTVMVQPNMPRFLRKGDQATLSARVMNTSEKAITGIARLELIDPETNQRIFADEKQYAISPEQSAGVQFDIPASQLAADALLIARISAEGKGYSDGEQHYLPILSDEELVTTTVPFTQNEPGTKTVDIAKLLADNGKTSNGKATVTVEYTNNPAWLMIQALPTVALTSDQNAISQAAAYYSNSIASHLLHQVPALKTIINLWKQESGKDNSLSSSLQKNEELKTMLLEETPWLADARHETEQRQLLINYFDDNAVQQRLTQNWDNLRHLQNADGSFCWWKGMPGNRYITTAVAKMLVRLEVMTGLKAPQPNLLNSAFAYLDRQASKEVAELKALESKGEKHLLPSNVACDYLYINALAGRKTTADIAYLINLLAKKPTELTIYGKANSAIILSQYGKTDKAAELLQSLNEYTVYKEEMGRYFDTPKALYSWRDYRIPSQVAAIEAMRALQPEKRQTIQEMQRWLLQEKRTQTWDTPLNTVDAVYAFFEKGTFESTSQEQAILKIDGKKIDLPKATAGLGYVKAVVGEPRPHLFTAEKTSAGTSWGALYLQTTQKSADVKTASAGLDVKRELLIGDQSVSRHSLQLHVGDKVTVRLTVTADRDYDFVQLQDKRAACLEPAQQLSGYHWGYYCSPKDNVTNYYFDRLAKGMYVVETTYYINRTGNYQTGICTVQCAYSPEFSGREAARQLQIDKK